jgi:hypothetical protein
LVEGRGAKLGKLGVAKEHRMGAHLIDGEFQSDKYPTCPRGKVPLSVKDVTAQDLLWQYAERRRAVDSEFADDLQTALRAAGYEPPEIVRCTCGANAAAAGLYGPQHSEKCALTVWFSKSLLMNFKAGQ